VKEVFTAVTTAFQIRAELNGVESKEGRIMIIAKWPLVHKRYIRLCWRGPAAIVNGIPVLTLEKQLQHQQTKK
jgi:hypothetical protein